MEKLDAVTLRSLVRKWRPVLEEESLPKITDRTRLMTTVVMMENQIKHFKEEFKTGGGYRPKTLLGEDIPTNYMGATSADNPTAGGIDIYNPVLISLLRRTVPNLIAYDIVGVQPMTGPTGLIFAFRPRYSNQSGGETWLTEDDTFFSASLANNSATPPYSNTQQFGTDPALANSTNYANSSDANSYNVGHAMTTALSEALGANTNNAFNEMAFTIESVNVTAHARGLRASYTRELAQDLRTVHGLDAETELQQILSQQILFDINREVIRSVNIVAVPGCQTGTANTGIFNLDIDSDGRWSVEKFKGLIFRMEREANAIAKATRRGKGNFILTGSDVASALRMTGLLDYNPQMSVTLNVDDTGNTFAGVLNGNIKVYIDPYFAATNGYEYFTMGYRGASAFDAGIFYCPYIPLEQYQAVDPLSFQPSIGYKTRYGLVVNPFSQPVGSVNGQITAGQNIYYRRSAIINLT